MSRNPRCQLSNEVVRTAIYKAQSPQRAWSLPGLTYTLHRPPHTPVRVSTAVTAGGLCAPLDCVLVMSPSICVPLGLFTLKHLPGPPPWETVRFHQQVGAWPSLWAPAPLLTFLSSRSQTPPTCHGLLSLIQEKGPLLTEGTLSFSSFNECRWLGYSKQVGDGPKADINVLFFNAT